MSSATNVRTDRRYTRDHEWAKQDGSEVIVGITPFAVEQLGDITMVNFDVGEGDLIEGGKAFGTVESVKTVSDLIAPISGKVVRLNGDLDGQPELVNDDCWEKGWMLVLEPSNPSAFQAELLDEAQYTTHISAQ